MVLLAGQVGAREADVHAFAVQAIPHQGFLMLVPAQSGNRPARPNPPVKLPVASDFLEDGGTRPSPLPAFSGSCDPSGIPLRTGLSRIAQLRRASLLPLVSAVACAEGVPVRLLDALVIHESRYNSAAVSNRGAIGLTQLMPGTVNALGVANPWSATQNLRGGARYLRQQLDAFGRYDLALAAYNAGPGQVLKHNGVPPFRETRDYVDGVLATLLEGIQPFSPSPGKAAGRTREGIMVQLMKFAAEGSHAGNR